MACDRASAHLAALRAFDADLFLLEQGLRRLARKEDRSAQGCETLSRWASERGYFHRILESTGPAPERRGLGADGPSFSLFVGVSAAEVDAAVHATRIEEQAGHPELESARRTTGRLLGYPACCVERFAADPRNDDRSQLVRLLGAGSARPWDPIDNWLVPAALVRHYPCQLGCAATHRAAAHAREVVAAVDPPLGAALGWILSRPLLVFDRFRVAVLDGPERSDGTIEVQRAYSFLDLASDEGAERSRSLRRFSQGLDRLPRSIGAAGLRGARLVRFAPGAGAGP